MVEVYSMANLSDGVYLESKFCNEVSEELFWNLMGIYFHPSP